VTASRSGIDQSSIGPSGEEPQSKVVTRRPISPWTDNHSSQSWNSVDPAPPGGTRSVAAESMNPSQRLATTPIHPVRAHLKSPASKRQPR
jgi:hypothetical protein